MSFGKITGRIKEFTGTLKTILFFSAMCKGELFDDFQ